MSERELTSGRVVTGRKHNSSKCHVITTKIS